MMGAVGYHVPANQTRKQSAVEYLTKDCNTTVHYASAKGNVVYIAYSTETEPDVVSAVVCLTWANNRDYYNFTIKLVDENMGPNDCDAPGRLLAMLTPTDNDYANEWRKDCRNLIDRRRATNKVKAGTTIRLTESLSFSDGVDRDTFTYVKGSKFRSADGYTVTVRRWRDRPFTIVEPVAA